MRLVLTNVTVIDCVRPRAVPGASVAIERGRIVEVLVSDKRGPHQGGGFPP